MLVTTYTCPQCKWTIYCRCSGDLHTCYCGSVECTGKVLDTVKIADKPIISGTIDLPLSPHTLELDFLYNGGKYGRVIEEDKK